MSAAKTNQTPASAIVNIYGAMVKLFRHLIETSRQTCDRL